MTKDEENSSGKDIVHRGSEEDIHELMKKFGVSEEDVQVAIQIVGDHREKVEKYLGNQSTSLRNTLW